MDQFRLDDLTRLVARRTERRSLAAGILGGLVAALLPGLNTTGSAAKRKRRSTCKKPKRRCGKKCINIKTSRQHCGTCNRACKPGHACRQGKCTPPPPPCGQGGPCQVFVTSTTHQGNLGGIAGAKLICNGLAKIAALPGVYDAWLSGYEPNGDLVSPADRFTHNPGPYVLTNGTEIAHHWSDLTDGNLLTPIRITESGQTVTTTSGVAWTSTLATGLPTGGGDFCGSASGSWVSNVEADQGRVGEVFLTDHWWSNRIFDGGFVPSCAQAFHLYCFQQS